MMNTQLLDLRNHVLFNQPELSKCKWCPLMGKVNFLQNLSGELLPLVAMQGMTKNVVNFPTLETPGHFAFFKRRGQVT
jgi:hypothetical protein